MDPWSKVDYSRHIREASMAMEGLPEVVPPSGRVPGHRLIAASILKRRQQRYREEIGKRTSILGVSSARAKYRRSGHRGGLPGIQKGPWHASSLAVPPGRLGPWWWPSGPTLAFREASGALIFYIIFPEFFGLFKYRENLKYRNKRKQELALGCTELIG